MLDPTGLGEKIRLYRRREGMTQTDLAEKIFVSFQAISSWECGSTLPDVENLCNLAKVFKISVDELLQKQDIDEEIFMIGVDGGGTSTEFALFSSEGHVLKNFKLPGSNSTTIGIEAALNILFDGIDLCLAEGKEVKAIFVGIAGNNYDELTVGLKHRYPNIDICVDSDGVSALFSAEGDVALICGTGSILLRKDGEKVKTVGGWGYVFGDPGSALNFGREAIKNALLYEDGGDASAYLYSLLKAKMGVKESFLIEATASSIANIARQASVVFDAYKAGDKVAENIIEEQMKQLNALINVACPNGGRIVACGGIMEHYNEIIIPVLNKYVKESIKFVLPKLPPVYGSCKACFDLFKLQEGEKFFDNFYKDYNLLH